MTTHEIYTVLVAHDKAKARAIREKRAIEEKLERLEELRAALTLRLREAQP